MTDSAADRAGGGLLRRVVAGDDTARAAFVDHAAPLLRRAIARKLSTLSQRPPLGADVEDLCNDVLARLMANDCRLLRSVQHAERIDHWLVAVASNHTADFARKHAARLRADTEHAARLARGEMAHPPHDAANGERAEIVRRELEELSPLDRLVLKLYYLDNLSYNEIGEITGMNLNTLAARLARARQRFRKHWERRANEHAV